MDPEVYNKRKRDGQDDGQNKKRQRIICTFCENELQGNPQHCDHCEGAYCEFSCFQLHLNNPIIGLDGHSFCRNAIRRCPYCLKYYCKGHSHDEHQLYCATPADDSEMESENVYEIEKEYEYVPAPRLNPESFQGIFIRQLHIGKDDPQDHTARAVTACRSDLNTIGIDGLDIGIATWNINHFQKAEEKKATFQRIFAQHSSWLDILVLQEVNASSKLEIDGRQIKMMSDNRSRTGKLIYNPGPMMMGLSIGEEPKDAHLESRSKAVKSRLGFVGGEPAWLKPHQQEFYPLIYLEGGKYPIEYITSAAFYLNELNDLDQLGGKPLYWNKEFGISNDGTVSQKTNPIKLKSDDTHGNLSKKQKRELKQAQKMSGIDPDAVHNNFNINVDLYKVPYFRPIIVHKLSIKRQLVNIAVVHTSPEGSKLARMGEYEQIAPFFKFISNDKSGALWVIAGDYYLDPESNIASNSTQAFGNPDELFKEQIKAHNLKFVLSVSATNQSILTKDVSLTREKKLREREKLYAEIEENPELIFKKLSRNTGEKQVKELKEEYEKDPRNAINYIGSTTSYDLKIDSVERETEKGIQHAVNKRADFFICSPEFLNTYAGIFNPLGGLLNVDPDHNALNWWRQISDHAPVGAVISTFPVSEKLRQIQKDQAVCLEERWAKAEKELSEIFLKAYNTIRGWFLYLDEEIKNDWGDGLHRERTRFHLLLNQILNDQGFEVFRTEELEKLDTLPNPHFAADEMLRLFKMSHAPNYDAFRTIYIRYLRSPFPVIEINEDEINQKWRQYFRSKLPRIVREAAPALRTLGFNIDDFDVTDKNQTYGGVNSKATK